MRHIKTSLIALGLAACASTTFAQVGTGGTITNGFASFTIGDYLGNGTGSGPLSDFRVGGAGNPDHLYKSWWWFRQAGDARETAFSGAIASSNNGSQLRIDYVYTDFTATMIYRVTGINNGFGFLTQQLTIHNTSNQAIAINLFNLNDIDLNASPSNDHLAQTGANIVRFLDAGGTSGWRADYEGTEAFAFDTTGSVEALLTDGGVTNLTGTGSTRSAGDWEGAYQWSMNLAVNEAATASATITIIPAPGAATLAGVAMVGAIRRRRS